MGIWNWNGNRWPPAGTIPGPWRGTRHAMISAWERYVTLDFPCWRVITVASRPRMSIESPRASTSRSVSRATVPDTTSPVKYEACGSSIQIRFAIPHPPGPIGSPDDEPGVAVRARRDPEPVHVHGRGPAVRAAQRDRAPGARGDHRPLDRRGRREVRPLEGARGREDREDDDDEEHDAQRPEEHERGGDPSEGGREEDHHETEEDDQAHDDPDDEGDPVSGSPPGRGPVRLGSVRRSRRWHCGRGGGLHGRGERARG